ncbi:MAG: hypothetical protein FD122_2771 [Stygiobacter sp.]|nr:MAG: hypothetical protein FD122_2771 [Stygiobacter sp.]KAF0214276.1 MAG: hypothetical protein FD178_2543 [Ignavibacteria bacterium]
MKVIVMFFLVSRLILAQQVGDSTFNPQLPHPFYKAGSGPTISIDEGHNNFHTQSGRYKPFADILTMDGYNVKPYSKKFSLKELDGTKILVISNALNERNTEDWTLPTPSAFTDDEIAQIVKWVTDGGNLFLISDHMPFPGAGNNLALKFGFKMNNGFAGDTTHLGAPDLFTKKDKTLNINFITEGRNESESVDSIYSFTGQAFQIPDNATPVLTLNSNFVSLMPDTAWNFKNNTPRISVAGWSQGAVCKFGKGRISVWGEAAMFSAQISNNKKVGMNAPYAKNNWRLLLNIIHWLDGKLGK